MKKFIILVREPDGRQDDHTEEQIKAHRANWNKWFEKYGKSGNFSGGSALSLNGRSLLVRMQKCWTKFTTLARRS